MRDNMATKEQLVRQVGKLQKIELRNGDTYFYSKKKDRFYFKNSSGELCAFRWYPEPHIVPHLRKLAKSKRSW